MYWVIPAFVKFFFFLDGFPPGLSITGLLTTLFVYIFSRLAQASVQALYNVLISPVVLGPGLPFYI